MQLAERSLRHETLLYGYLSGAGFESQDFCGV